jgi:hypothetical protein
LKGGVKIELGIDRGYLMKTAGIIVQVQLKKILSLKKDLNINWLLIILITVICWGWEIHQPGLGYPDEAAHLMDGAFIRASGVMI